MSTKVKVNVSRQTELCAAILSSEKATLDALHDLVTEIFPAIIAGGSCSGINDLRNNKMLTKGRRTDIDWLTGYFLPNVLKDNGRLGKQDKSKKSRCNKRMEEFLQSGKRLSVFMREKREQKSVKEKTPEQILAQHQKSAANALRKLYAEDKMTIEQVLQFAADTMNAIMEDQKKSA